MFYWMECLGIGIIELVWMEVMYFGEPRNAISDLNWGKTDLLFD